MVENQLISFVIYIFIGSALGILFDFFRAIRKSIKHSNIATYIEDIIYVIISFFIVTFALQIISDGELRFYIFIGILIGIIICFLLLSKYLLGFETSILKVIKRILQFIISLFKKVNFKINVKQKK